MDPRGAEEGFTTGEWCEANKMVLEKLKEGVEIVASCTYWGAPCQLSGKIQGLLLLIDGTAEVTMEATGADHEELLKWITGQAGHRIRLHLCGTHCPNRVDANGLVHASRIRLKRPEDQGGWADNLQVETDELKNLREEAKKREEREKEAKTSDKKEKRKKEEKKRSSSSSDRKERKSKKSKRSRQRPEGQKSLDNCFGKTGLDPSPKVRRKIKAYMKHKLKKKKDLSTDSSLSTGSQEGEEEKEDDERSLESEDLFEDAHRIRRIATKGPGLLAGETIREMQRNLLTTTGQVWEQEVNSIPPVSLQYFRQRLAPQLSGGQAREALTLSWCLDLLLQGRVASAADALRLGQRLKSIELAATGASWGVAQKVEICPQEKAILSTRSETLDASRENREEMKTMQLAKGKSKGKGEGSGSWYKGGSKGDVKGRDAKGKSKRTEKEEGKK